MNDDLELGPGWFSAECQLVEMRISTVKSEVMVLSKKKVECSLWVGRNDLLLPVQFKHLWDFFTSEGKVKRKADRLVQHLHSLQRSTGLLWWIEEGLKSKLFISPHMLASHGYCPKEYDHGYECWKWASSKEYLGLRVELLLLHTDRSQLRWFRHLCNPDQFLLGDRWCPGEYLWDGRLFVCFRYFILGSKWPRFISPNKCKTVFIQNYKLSDARVKEHWIGF